MVQSHRRSGSRESVSESLRMLIGSPSGTRYSVQCGQCGDAVGVTVWSSPVGFRTLARGPPPPAGRETEARSLTDGRVTGTDTQAQEDNLAR